jgi:hypothetical protein
MAEKGQQDQSKGLDEVDDAMSEATGDTAKVPNEEEAEPANTEGSEAQRP